MPLMSGHRTSKKKGFQMMIVQPLREGPSIHSFNKYLVSQALLQGLGILQ